MTHSQPLITYIQRELHQEDKKLCFECGRHMLRDTLDLLFYRHYVSRELEPKRQKNYLHCKAAIYYGVFY